MPPFGRIRRIVAEFRSFSTQPRLKRTHVEKERPIQRLAGFIRKKYQEKYYRGTWYTMSENLCGRCEKWFRIETSNTFLNVIPFKYSVQRFKRKIEIGGNCIVVGAYSKWIETKTLATWRRLWILSVEENVTYLSKKMACLEKKYYLSPDHLDFSTWKGKCGKSLGHVNFWFEGE